MNTQMTRRDFLKKSSLVVAATAFSGHLDLFNASPVLAAADSTFKPHAFVEIATDDTVTVWLGQTNLGQGTHTGIPMIVADELDADWDKVQARMALAADVFKHPHWHMQFTGGSTSIRHRWEILRKPGAAARQMLKEAAAKQWRTSASTLKTRDGKVIHPDGRTLRYGELVEAASRLPVPENPPLKDPKAWRIIGTERRRLDIPDKATGKTVYGMDFSVPGMCTAVVARPPRYHAVPESYDADAAMAVKGVIKVVPLEDRIGVCADTTWAAIKGREALKITWSQGSHPDLSDATIHRKLKALLEKPGLVGKNEGDAPKALAGAAASMESEYQLPYLAHAQVEPTNCTAHVEKERCRVWIPTQGQTGVLMTAAAITGLPQEKIEVMTLPAGGGFGIRGEAFVVMDAVSLSKAVGMPVKVIWTREDEFAHDCFRPASYCRIKGGIDRDGRVIAWWHRVASQSIMARMAPAALREDGYDVWATDGITEMPYLFPNHFVDYCRLDLPIPVGTWRSVAHSQNTFMVESFMDELAHKAGKDPVQFRLDHMEKESRSHRTLTLLAERAKWGSPVPEGRSRGVAVADSFGSTAAHMAEVSVNASGVVTVHKVVCALDCGPAIFPDAIRAQAEGGVVMGLSTAFHERVRFADGGVKTSNYDAYPVLTMAQVPEIEVHIANSRHPIGGVGEPVYTTVPPAVANAVFSATGVRIRQLPIDREWLKKA